MSVWYFGCYREVGHFLHREGGIKSYDLPKDCPFNLGEFDTGLLLGLDPKDRYRPSTQSPGEGVLVHREDWTYLSFWDRTVDKRGNSNSGFLVKGELLFEEVVEKAQDAFPEVWKRFDFEVRLRG